MIRRQETIDRAMTVEGMLDRPQLEFLFDLAKQAPDGTAVECGVFCGRSVAAWAPKRYGRGTIVAIDNWTDRDRLRETFLFNMTQLGIHCRVITGNSWEAARKVGAVAFCFIDADHHEEGIGRDVPAWTPKIIPGGIIAFHDYETWKTPAVREAVDKWQQTAQWDVIGVVGSAIAFRRPSPPAPLPEHQERGRI